jgi:formate hydrogenlyase transcriptional activator
LIDANGGLLEEELTMDNRKAEAMAPLESVLRIEQLRQRCQRPADYGTESRILVSLAQALADAPRAILQTLADKILEGLHAGSAGLSLLTRNGERFYWAAIAGAWAPHIGGGTPRDFGPCGDVLDRNIPLLFTHWERRYPYLSTATPLADEGLLVPFRVAGKVVGTIWAISHDQHREFDTEDLRLLESMGRFASAAYQTVESLEAIERSRVALSESEERFRDLFDEAPIAYVHQGLDTRIFRANRMATKLLGVKPGEIEGMLGTSFFPDTPEAQRRFRDALPMLASGTDEKGVVLELQRKDDGRPLWVRWWCRPEPGGNYWRSMFIDITRQVLIEQERTRLRTQNEYLQEEIRQVHNVEEIVGRSAALDAVLDHVRLVAPTDSTVLILGETGTGKELIARAIHSGSMRSDRPLIKVSCAALPASLIESELFGHEKGAFTGATDKRIGRFELANEGTIFLDEIGELPPEVQIKLLRVLQEHEFERIGGGATLRVDIRVIAATNRDLNRAVAEGKFRRDLFYRLNVFPILMPTLRQRADDIPLLAHYIMRRCASRIGRRIEHIPAATLARLAAYSWPGNIRELENVIERAVILSRGPDLDLASGLIPSIADAAAGGAQRETESGGAAAAAERSLAQIDKDRIIAVLKQTNWHIEGPNGAAAILKLNPSTLRSRIKKLGVERSRDSTS